MTIIGLSGRKKSGKDTVCSLIQEAVGHGVRRFAFADALKCELSEATGVPVDQIESNKDRFRLGLQWWGTEFRRSQDENYWVSKLKQAINESVCEYAIVTDCRFKNEADTIREMGGIVVRIERDSCRSGDSHTSETSMDGYDFDYVIQNNGTLFQLRCNVMDFLAKDLNGGALPASCLKRQATPEIGHLEMAGSAL